MIELQKPVKFGEFVRNNEEFLMENPMLYHFPIHSINAAGDGKLTIYNWFNIVRTGDFRLFAMVTDQACMLYTTHYDPEVLPLLSKEIEFDKFNKYEFAGTKALIEGLFDHHSTRYELQKHRIIYRCRSVIATPPNAAGRLEMGDPWRLQQLAQMCVRFVKEYEDRAITIEEGAASIYKCIQRDGLYCWMHNNQICSMAEVLTDDYDFPVIGHFYTPLPFRGKGYGASLMYEITKGLLDAGHEYCMLSTNASNGASNKIFQRVGYEATGDYTLAYKLE